MSPSLPSVVRISRKQVAEWQIDNAILVWFQDEEDVVSPHTLTVAAQGVLTVLCKDMHKPLSKVVSWINQQPKSFQEQIRNPQNFFKHGYHKQRFKDVSSFTPELTEMFLIDNVAVYQDLFASVTIPMTVFALRFSIMHPKGLKSKSWLPPAERSFFRSRFHLLRSGLRESGQSAPTPSDFI